MFDEDGFFEFPSSLATLDGVPAEVTACYEPAAAGGFRLTREAAKIADDGNAALATARQAHAAALADRDKVIEQTTEALHGMIARTSIVDAFDAQGVAGKFAPAGLALFMSTHKIEVDEPTERYGEHVVIVRDRFGLQSVDNAVRAWLVSDEGKAYLPAPKFQGEFGRLIADLKKQP